MTNRDDAERLIADAEQGKDAAAMLLDRFNGMVRAISLFYLFENKHYRTGNPCPQAVRDAIEAHFQRLHSDLVNLYMLADGSARMKCDGKRVSVEPRKRPGGNGE